MQRWNLPWGGRGLRAAFPDFHPSTTFQRGGKIFCSYLALIGGEGNDTPLQYSCLENPMDGRAWWAAVCGVAQSGHNWSGSSSSSCFDWKCHGICTWGGFSSTRLILLWWEYKKQKITFELRRFLPFPTFFTSRIHSTPKCVAFSQSEGSCNFFFCLPWILTFIEGVILCHLAYTPFLCSYLASCLL